VEAAAAPASARAGHGGLAAGTAGAGAGAAARGGQEVAGGVAVLEAAAIREAAGRQRGDVAGARPAGGRFPPSAAGLLSAVVLQQVVLAEPIVAGDARTGAAGAARGRGIELRERGQGLAAADHQAGGGGGEAQRLDLVVRGPGL